MQITFAAVVRIAVAALFGYLTFAPALAQDYPSKPVRTVVPFAAGGASDILARVLAQ